jgi:hypothetical protein
MLIGSWQWNSDFHAKQKPTQPNTSNRILGNNKLGFYATVHHHQSRRTFFPEIGSEHSIRTSKQCTSSFQHSFSLNHANKDESSRNTFTH